MSVESTSRSCSHSARQSASTPSVSYVTSTMGIEKGLWPSVPLTGQINTSRSSQIATADRDQMTESLQRVSRRSSSCWRARRSRTSRIKRATVPSSRREQLARAAVISILRSIAFGVLRNEKTRRPLIARTAGDSTNSLFQLLHFTHDIVPRFCRLFSRFAGPVGAWPGRTGIRSTTKGYSSLHYIVPPNRQIFSTTP